MSIEALKAGAHVLCEKPLADRLDGVDDLAAAIAASERQFMVGFCFRYHEGLLKAKSHLDAGRIGRLVSIRCRMGEHLPTVRPDYRTLFTARYSGAFDLTHEIDLTCWFAGAKPATAVQALFGQYSDVDMEAPDVVELLIRFGDDCLASVHLDFFSRPRCRVTELIGTAGTVSVEFASWDRAVVSLYEAERGQWQHETLVTDRDDMFRAEDLEFLRAVTAGGREALGIEEARRSLEIIEAAHAPYPQ
jgi:predicted dehydrogenase